MAFPSRPHTFALENCRNLLDKLKREIDRLRSAASDDFNTHNDSAFNAAVTAWHLCDWVFADMTPDQRGKLNILKIEDMRGYARTQCRALHLCRQVATASKHWRVERYPDPNVKVITTANSIPVTETIQPAGTQPAKIQLLIERGCFLYFDDDGDVRAAEDVFDDASQFWTQFIYHNGIAQDESQLNIVL
jgi:hypothetical protein